MSITNCAFRFFFSGINCHATKQEKNDSKAKVKVLLGPTQGVEPCNESFIQRLLTWYFQPFTLRQILRQGCCHSLVLGDCETKNDTYCVVEIFYLQGISHDNVTSYSDVFPLVTPINVYLLKFVVQTLLFTYVR